MARVGERPDRRAYVRTLRQHRAWLIGEQIPCGWNLMRWGETVQNEVEGTQGSDHVRATERSFNL